MKNIIDIIGNTPLIKIDLDIECNIFAKLEYLNPGGSIKDRSALYIINHAEKNNLIKPGYTLIEASSGNQAIAIAMIGSYRKYKVIITALDNTSKEKLNTIKAYGAEIILCPSTALIEDDNSHYSIAKKLSSTIDNSFMVNQYYNQLNIEAHYNGIAPEIWNQTNGKVTHVFAAVGTGGTISGIGKFLKNKNRDIKIIGVDSINSFRSTNGKPKPHNLEGLGANFYSPLIDQTTIDEFITIKDEEGFNILKYMAQNHGLLIGLSSAAVIQALLKYKDKLTKNDNVVLILGDSGRAYFSKVIF